MGRHLRLTWEECIVLTALQELGSSRPSLAAPCACEVQGGGRATVSAARRDCGPTGTGARARRRRLRVGDSESHRRRGDLREGDGEDE